MRFWKESFTTRRDPYRQTGVKNADLQNWSTLVIFDPKPWAYPMAKRGLLDKKKILLKVSNRINRSENVP